MLHLMTPSPETTPSPGDDARWNAVQRRDHAADGTFVYSVRTTGVYCRPSCAARLPRRENVAFHQTSADAERAGFRPCKRCRPNEPARADRQAAAVATACRLIEEAEEVPSLDVLAQAADMSRFHFHRVFKSVTGVTPKAYAEAHRGNRVREELAARDTVTQAIYGAGFNSGSRFYAASSGLLGMTPTQFRAGGSGNVIRFAVGECSLGAVLVAATTRASARSTSATIRIGWCAVCRIVSRTRGWSAATRPSSSSWPRWWASSMPPRKVSTSRSTFAAPLSSGGYGTPSAASRPGSTASYAEIARRIGAPKAVRAVAQACASNALAVAIPCHRVVRTDGQLSGYRWGVARKRALLAREARA